MRGDSSVEMRKMTIGEVVSFLLSLVPYLNASTVTLIVSLGFERVGFKIPRREFRSKPVQSLLWGMCLLLISSLCVGIIQSRLLGLEPLLALLFCS